MGDERVGVPGQWGTITGHSHGEEPSQDMGVRVFTVSEGNGEHSLTGHGDAG